MAYIIRHKKLVFRESREPGKPGTNTERTVYYSHTFDGRAICSYKADAHRFRTLEEAEKVAGQLHTLHGGVYKAIDEYASDEQAAA